MLTAWRIVKTRYAAQSFDGEGARLYGGRWSSRGTRIVYTSETIALAVLEVLVHLKESSILSSYSRCAVHFNESLVTKLDHRKLPANWREYPAPAELQLIGDSWVTNGASVVLEVPSVIVESESNYLINPSHPDFTSLKMGKLEPFEFDWRLLKK